MVRRVVRALGRPGDLILALRLAWFIARSPVDLERRELHAFLCRLRGAPRPAASDVDSSRQRIARLRRDVLQLPWFRRRDTCYVRALTLYRFVDAGRGDLRFHLGVEERADPADRLHGHAWVSVDGVVLEEDPTTSGRPIQEVDLGRPS